MWRSAVGNNGFGMFDMLFLDRRCRGNDRHLLPRCDSSVMLMCFKFAEQCLRKGFERATNIAMTAEWMRFFFLAVVSKATLLIFTPTD